MLILYLGTPGHTNYGVAWDLGNVLIKDTPGSAVRRQSINWTITENRLDSTANGLTNEKATCSPVIQLGCFLSVCIYDDHVSSQGMRLQSTKIHPWLTKIWSEHQRWVKKQNLPGMGLHVSRNADLTSWAGKLFRVTDQFQWRISSNHLLNSFLSHHRKLNYNSAGACYAMISAKSSMI